MFTSSGSTRSNAVRWRNTPAACRRASCLCCDRWTDSRAVICSTVGRRVLLTISIFDNVDEAVASNVKAADWVRNNVLEFTKGVPES
jgi:hypothetical protein